MSGCCAPGRPAGDDEVPAGPPPGAVGRAPANLVAIPGGRRYRVAARSANGPDSSAGNLGFRVAASV